MIEKFIKRHHVMTLAVGSPPWCAAVFYAWDGKAFIYASGMETRHAQAAMSDARAAGNIVLESRTVGRLQGLQIEGRTRETNDPEHRKAYLRRFPFAAMDLSVGLRGGRGGAAPPAQTWQPRLRLWVFEPAHMKLTDNRLGFGKKIEWNG